MKYCEEEDETLNNKGSEPRYESSLGLLNTWAEPQASEKQHLCIRNHEGTTFSISSLT